MHGRGSVTLLATVRRLRETSTLVGRGSILLVLLVRGRGLLPLLLLLLRLREASAVLLLRCTIARVVLSSSLRWSLLVASPTIPVDDSERGGELRDDDASSCNSRVGLRHTLTLGRSVVTGSVRSGVAAHDDANGRGRGGWARDDDRTTAPFAPTAGEIAAQAGRCT